MSENIFSAESAKNLVLDQIIPEINDEIKEACEDHKNFIIHEFRNVSGPTLDLIKFVLEQYEKQGYKITQKDDSTYMLTWV